MLICDRYKLRAKILEKQLEQTQAMRIQQDDNEKVEQGKKFGVPASDTDTAEAKSIEAPELSETSVVCLVKQILQEKSDGILSDLAKQQRLLQDQRAEVMQLREEMTAVTKTIAAAISTSPSSHNEDWNKTEEPPQVLDDTENGYDSNNHGSSNICTTPRQQLRSLFSPLQGSMKWIVGVVHQLGKKLARGLLFYWRKFCVFTYGNAQYYPNNYYSMPLESKKPQS